MAVWEKTRSALSAGETVLGHFAPAGAEYEVPGGLSWSAEDGARVELGELIPDWPHDLRGASYTVHGRTRDGDRLTLMDAWTKARALGDRAKTVRSSTLALGEFTEPTAVWPRAIYSTTNQGEWRADTGLDYERPEPRLWQRVVRREPEARLRVELRRPTRDEVSVPGSRLAFDGEIDTAVAYAPEWSVSTRQVLVANVDKPATAVELRRRYGEPLLALTSLAADRPDSILHEVVLDPASRRRIEIWRAGPNIEPQE